MSKESRLLLGAPQQLRLHNLLKRGAEAARAHLWLSGATQPVGCADQSPVLPDGPLQVLGWHQSTSGSSLGVGSRQDRVLFILSANPLLNTGARCWAGY